jgi:hypothetical protein
MWAKPWEKRPFLILSRFSFCWTTLGAKDRDGDLAWAQGAGTEGREWVG